MRHQRHAVIVAVSVFAGCGAEDKLEEPRQVIALQAEVERSTFPFVFVASEQELGLFLGCYEIVLGPRFPRPPGWPESFSLELTSNPGRLQAWRQAKSSYSAGKAPGWTFRDGRRALISWDLPERQVFQLELRFAHQRFLIVSTSGHWPIESRSVTKLACE